MKFYFPFSITTSSLFFVIAATTTVVGAAVTKTTPTSTSTSTSALAAAYSLMETQERVEGYHQRGYEWPVAKFVPDTPGWNQLMNDRLEQISDIVEPNERFKGYTATMYSGLVISNYTEYGFARTRISDSLLEELQQGIIDGYDDRRNEGYTPSITGNQAWHIERDDLTAKVEEELHDKLEEWGGVDLDLTYVYGLRLFRNSSTIKMHIDKKGSHSMGYILHVASSDDYAVDTDPWPFLIEDFHGRTHEVTMVPGDLIFFEAAKLVHGRPHKLNASWYCNVVGHYYPRDEVWASMNHMDEAKYAVPPKWVNDIDDNDVDNDDNNDDAGADGSPSTASSSILTTNTKKNKKSVDLLEFRGGLREPDCIDGWCRSTSPDLVKWKGPAGSDTHWIDATGKTHEFVGRSKNVDEL